MASYKELTEELGALQLRSARSGISPILTQEIIRVSRELKAMDKQMVAIRRPTGNYPK